MTVALIDCGSEKFPALREACDPHAGRVEVTALAAANALDLGGIDAIVISGGPHLFTAEDPAARTELESSFRFLHGQTPPVLGICLGMQAIALAAGATIYRGEARREEDMILLTDDDHPLLHGIPSGTAFAEDHCEGVTPPPGFDVLGRSGAYPVEIIAKDATHRYGAQFHPETSGTPGQKIIANFLRLAGGS